MRKTLEFKIGKSPQDTTERVHILEFLHFVGRRRIVQPPLNLL